MSRPFGHTQCCDGLSAWRLHINHSADSLKAALMLTRSANQARSAHRTATAFTPIPCRALSGTDNDRNRRGDAEQEENEVTTLGG